MSEQQFDHEVDVLVVGTGAGGLTASLAAKANGLDVLVIEKAALIGGSSALSGGGCWVPYAPVLRRAGVPDDRPEMLEYLKRIAGDVVPEARLRAYLDEAPKMMEFLESQSTYMAEGFFWITGYSDYHPDKGGSADGHGLWATPVDKRLLGEDMKLLRPGLKRMQLPLGAWLTSRDLRDLLAVRWGGLRGKKMLLVLAKRVIRARVLGERIATSGAALVTRLWLTRREKDVPVWLETPMKSLIQDDSGRVVGVEVEREGRTQRLRARHGVILATGGFDHNMEMRAVHQPEITGEWSMGSRDNQGDGHRAGEAIGAALDLMDDAWWMPTVEMPDRTVAGTVAERQYPGQIIVNQIGKRFVNEAAPYTDFVHAQIEGQRSGVGHIPAWMIIDDRAWKRNIIAGHLPGTAVPKAWLESGMIRIGQTIEELAEKIGAPPENLRETIDRFNGFVRKGVDEDFHRGESPYERFYGDDSYPNPNLAELSKPPFYAIEFTPGDLGTKGGLVTNEHAQVLREDGSVIPGLYATGNVSSSVMGRDYAGPGATLGPAMTFGYVAANHIAATASESVGEPETAATS
jgi:succinate dehydrogenase/fumarate reductase flavoprotein subunit